MKAINIIRMVAAFAIATVGMASPSQAAVTAFLSAGTNCSGANSASYTTGAPGPTFKVSLCVSATAEALCGTSYRFLSANAGENGRFNLTARAMDAAYNFSNVAVVAFPIPINNTATGDLGAGTATNLPVAAASNQLIATLDLQPQSTAVNASYVISLDGAFSSATVDGGDSTCGGGAPTTSAPLSASFTLNLSASPAFTSAAPPAGAVGVAYTHNFTASGSPAPTFAVTTGTVPAGFNPLAAGGALTGTPTTAGTFNFTVTASNGALPNATQAVSLVIGASPQVINFPAQTTPSRPFAPAGTFAIAPVATGGGSGNPIVYSSTTAGVCTVSGTTVTIVTAGTCTIAANQAGNANFTAATQVTQNVTITTTVPGAPTVTAAAGNAQGTLTITPPANNGGTAITGYTATCNPNAGTDANAGNTTLVRTITGLVNNVAHTCSVTAANAVGPGAAGVSNSFTPSLAPVPPAFTSAATLAGTFGVAIAPFNVTASGVPTPTITAGAAPAGLVFASGGANAGTATITGTPSAAGTFNYVLTATGTAPAATQTLVITIAKANQTITFPAVAAQTFSATAPFTVAATSDSTLTVTFSSTTPAVCTVAGTSVTMVTAGTCTIVAAQAGNTNYNAATSVPQNITINKANQTITFGAQANRGFSTAASNISPAATATSGLVVTYSSTTPAVCTVAGATVTTVALGTCTIAADQAGNTNFNAAPQVTQSFTVTQGAQTISFSGIPDQPINAPPFSATSFASATSGLAITFASTTPTVCTTTGANGATVTLLLLGTCTIQASQAGNANFAAAPNVTRSFNVIPPGAVTLVSSANPVAYGGAITLTASVGGNNPTGTVTFTVATANGTFTLCNAVPLASAAASCFVAGKYNVTANVAYTASYSGDTNNNPNSASLFELVNLNASTLTAVANPLQIVAGRPVTLKAMLVARNLTGNVTFNENGVALTGCSNLPVQALPGATDTGVATCTISSITAGAHNYVVTYPHPTDAGFEQVIVPVTAAASGPVDYTDMWWAGTSENGWGVSITQHGAIQFAVFYVYDAAGKPTFYAMPGGSFNAAGTAFTGALYQPTSSPFTAYDFNQFKPGGVTNASVGTATITYTSSSAATVNYTINGISGTKSIQRQAFATDDGLPKLQVNDMWWGGPAQNGWGVNIAQQGRVLFPVWYTYDAAGKAIWFGVPGGTWSGSTYTGDIYTVNSSPWLGVSYVATQFNPAKVGTMVLSFVDQSTATMTYTVNGVTQTKFLTRQPY